MRVVVIGNGVAGMQAAVTIRRREPRWPITIVSEESDDFFSRTALMYVLCGQLSYADTQPLEPGAYERLGFRRVRARATAVRDGQVHLMGLPPLAFDALVIATGSSPRRPPWPGAGLRGVGHFVTLQDLAWLEREVHGGPCLGGQPPRPHAHLPHSDARSPYAVREVAAERRGAPARRPVVIGGGLVGVEVVETLLAAGLRPTFLLREEWFWPIALDVHEGRWILDALTAHGVDARAGQHVTALEGDAHGNVAVVVTEEARIEADLVVVAIGVVPNAIEGVACDAAGGILVDDQLRTNVPGVWAAGDCASVEGADGSRRPEQLWYTGRDQGRVAGENVLGDGRSYRRGIPYNAAKLMDVEYTTVGHVGGPDWAFEETGRVRSRTRLCHEGGRLVGFNALGRRWDHEVIGRWIRERRTLAWVVDHLREAAFDTELVPPLVIPAAARPRVSA